MLAVFLDFLCDASFSTLQYHLYTRCPPKRLCQVAARERPYCPHTRFMRRQPTEPTSRCRPTERGFMCRRHIPLRSSALPLCLQRTFRPPCGKSVPLCWLLTYKAPPLILFLLSKAQLYCLLRHADHAGVDFTAKLRGGRPAARPSLTVASEQSSSEGAYSLSTTFLLQSVLPAPALPSSPPPTSDCSETTPSWVGKGRM